MLNVDLGSLALMIVLNLVTLPILIIMNNKGEQFRPYRLVQTVTLMIVDICYIGTAFINPGVVVVAPTRQRQTSQFCDKCRLWKSEGQKHCDACQICIRDGVHHCPLLGTHIGKYNHIAFFFYVLAMFMWCMNVCVSVAVLVSK
jgi:hypothetical protein